jgi:hypothetical protein
MLIADRNIAEHSERFIRDLRITTAAFFSPQRGFL